MTSKISVYDTVVGQWHLLPRMLSNRFGLGTAVSPDGRYLYAVGGFGCHGESSDSVMALASVEVLDLRSVKARDGTARWKALPSMNHPRGNLGLTMSHEGKLYASAQA